METQLTKFAFQSIPFIVSKPIVTKSLPSSSFYHNNYDPVLD